MDITVQMDYDPPPKKKKCKSNNSYTFLTDVDYKFE